MMLSSPSLLEEKQSASSPVMTTATACGFCSALILFKIFSRGDLLQRGR